MGITTINIVLDWNGMNMDDLVQLKNQAVKLVNENRFTDAALAFQESFDGLEALMGPTHTTTLSVLSSFVTAAIENQVPEEVAPRMRKSMDDHISSLGLHHIKTLQSITRFAIFHKAQGKLGEAEIFFERARDGFRDLTALDPEQLFSNTFGIIQKLVEIAIDQKDFVKAESELVLLISQAEDLGSSYHHNVMDLKHNLCHLYDGKLCSKYDGEDQLNLQPTRKLEQLLLELIDYAKSKPSSHLSDANICPWKMLTKQYVRLEQHEKLTALQEETDRFLSQPHFPTRKSVIHLKLELARSYVMLHKYDKAEWWFLHLQELIEDSCTSGGKESFEITMHHALMFLQQDQWQNAEPLFKEAQEKVKILDGSYDGVYDRITDCLETKRYVSCCPECEIN